MSSQLIYVAGNRNVSNPKKPGTHSSVIYQNYHYWWADDNKRSTRFTCVEKTNKKCSGSITIAQKSVIRSTDHSHLSLSDNQVKITIKNQESKKKVFISIAIFLLIIEIYIYLNEQIETNTARTVYELYKDAQDELVSDNVPENVIAAELGSLRQQSTGLHKRRAKTLPSLSNNFVELNINGEYALTTGGMPFLRYDNKLENNRIILLGCDQTIKILGEANDWFMDGTFKSAPAELLQIYTLHGRLDGHFSPCMYLLMKKKR